MRLGRADAGATRIGEMAQPGVCQRALQPVRNRVFRRLSQLLSERLLGERHLLGHHVPLLRHGERRRLLGWVLPVLLRGGLGLPELRGEPSQLLRCRRGHVLRDLGGDVPHGRRRNVLPGRLHLHDGIDRRRFKGLRAAERWPSAEMRHRR